MNISDYVTQQSTNQPINQSILNIKENITEMSILHWKSPILDPVIRKVQLEFGTW
jgi:hypothetical protein